MTELLIQVTTLQKKLDDALASLRGLKRTTEEQNAAMKRELFSLESEVSLRWNHPIGFDSPLKVMRLENESRKADEKANSMTEDYQSLKVELEDITAEADFAKSQFAELQGKHHAQSEDLKYTEKALRVGCCRRASKDHFGQETLAKVSAHDEEVQKLEQSLANKDQANSELACALRKVADLNATITSLEEDMGKLVRA